MDSSARDVEQPVDATARPLWTRALARESVRARQLVAAGEWRLSPADAEAIVAVLAFSGIWLVLPET